MRKVLHSFKLALLPPSDSSRRETFPVLGLPCQIPPKAGTECSHAHSHWRETVLLQRVRKIIPSLRRTPRPQADSYERKTFRLLGMLRGILPKDPPQ